MILPSFDYCDVVWAGLNKGLSDRLQKLYNRAARIITQSDWGISSADILKMLQEDTLGVRRYHRHHTMIMMLKLMKKKKAPKNLTETLGSLSIYDDDHKDDFKKQ